MTAPEIIQEIKRLPRDEREKVMNFARSLEPGQISAEEIGDLVQKMVDAGDPAEAKKLEEEIVRGFYGSLPHA
jgi:hypothetical protein